MCEFEEFEVFPFEKICFECRNLKPNQENWTQNIIGKLTIYLIFFLVKYSFAFYK
jgi:hypothetical protein